MITHSYEMSVWCAGPGPWHVASGGPGDERISAHTLHPAALPVHTLLSRPHSWRHSHQIIAIRVSVHPKGLHLFVYF